MSWSDERISTLKKMWQQGKSASEIAEKLGGVTRNAVIGKAHRLGLSGRPSPITKPAPVKKAAAPAAKKPVAPAPKKSYVAPKAVVTPAPAKKPVPPPTVAKASAAPAAKAPPPKANMPGKPPEPIILAAMASQTSRADGKVLSILDLKERMCRWPVGDPKESGFGYCGGVAITSHPYCAEHVAIAFQAPNRKDGKKPKDIKMAEAPELEDLEVEVEDDEEAEDETLADDLDDDDDAAVTV